MNLQNDQFKVVTKLLEHIQSNGEITHRDMNDIFKEQQQLILRVGALENRQESLEAFIKKIPDKTQDRIADAVAPILEQTEDLTTEIAKKGINMVIFRKKPNIFKRLFRKKGD